MPALAERLAALALEIQRGVSTPETKCIDAPE
jgi:hypothetical protein